MDSRKYPTICIIYCINGILLISERKKPVFSIYPRYATNHTVIGGICKKQLHFEDIK